MLQLTAGIGRDYQDLEKHPDNIGMRGAGPVALLLRASVTAAARVCAHTHTSLVSLSEFASPMWDTGIGQWQNPTATAQRVNNTSSKLPNDDIFVLALEYYE